MLSFGKCYHSVNVIIQLMLSFGKCYHLINVIIRLMLSVSLSPKVIPLHGNYCTYVCGPLSYPFKMPLVVSQNEMPSQIIKKNYLEAVITEM